MNDDPAEITIICRECKEAAVLYKQPDNSYEPIHSCWIGREEEFFPGPAELFAKFDNETSTNKT